MKSKRIIALLLCVVLSCLALVSCSDEVDWLKIYDWKPEVVHEAYYDFYIVVGEGTDKMAKETVNTKLNQLLYEKYKTKISIHYIDAASYETELAAALNSTEAPTVPKGYHYGGKILLINDYGMLSSIKIGESTLEDELSPLDAYLATNAFGTLNTQIASTLLDAAQETSNGTLAIPNNRRFGEYTYCVVNRLVAENDYSFSAQTEIPTMTSPEAASDLLTASGATSETAENGDVVYKTSDGKVILYLTKGQYEDKARIEADGEWMCNVSEYPVATVEEAYASAFGIVPGTNLTEEVEVKVEGVPTMQTVVTLDCTERAMEVIYAINTDSTIRNTLQYGVENTNFRLVDGFVEPISSEDSNYNYNMELIYTGDVLKAYYLKDVWTKEMAENTKNQNNESVLAQ